MVVSFIQRAAFFEFIHKEPTKILKSITPCRISQRVIGLLCNRLEGVSFLAKLTFVQTPDLHFIRNTHRSKAIHDLQN